MGIYTHANGVQEMVSSFNENQYQLQAELLRHGALDWATRGVYFGDQRNYYEADIDDNFLSDDSWSTTAHTTDYNPADALRETPPTSTMPRTGLSRTSSGSTCCSTVVAVCSTRPNTPVPTRC